MNNLVHKPPEIISSSRLKRYNCISLLRDGKLLLEDTTKKRKVSGKFLSAASENELHIRRKLQHENINKLLDFFCITDRMKILISPFIGNPIGTLIHDDSFNKHPRCFNRKKSYAKDILSALNYMHSNSVFHLSLSDENIAVCPDTDAAILCDFSYAVATETVIKRSLPSNRNYPSPEVENGGDSEILCSSPIDMWDSGVLLLQIFTMHQLPRHKSVKDSLEFPELVQILKKTNPGARINKAVAREFKAFILPLLSENPYRRPSAEEALLSYFLQTLHNRLDEKARSFWMSGIESSAKDNLSGSDIDIVNLTGARYSKQRNLKCTKSGPDTIIQQSIPSSPLSTYDNRFNNFCDSDCGKLIDARYPKSEKQHLTRMESKPHSTLHQEDLHLTPSAYSSSLTASDIDVMNLTDEDVINITDQDDNVSMSDQEHVVTVTNAKSPKSDKSCLTCEKCNSMLYPESSHRSSKESSRSQLMSRNKGGENVDSKKNICHGNITEWEIDDPVLINEDLKELSDYSEEPGERTDELPKNPSYSLEQLIPYIISMSEMNSIDCLSNSCNSLSKIFEELQPQDKSSVSKTEINEWFDISLENRHENAPIQSENNSNGKKRKNKKKVSINDSLDLISRKSAQKDLKKSRSPIIVDKSDLYQRSETGVAGNRQRIVTKNRLAENPFPHETIAVHKRKKWYHKLLFCVR